LLFFRAAPELCTLTNLTITENLTRVRTEITEAAVAAGRNPTDIRLIAVSKTKPVSLIAEAIAAGQMDFGENYVQEAVKKIEALPGSDAVWHFIGAIQSNKTRDLARHFDWIHTVEREKTARRLSDQCPADKRLNICLQINVDADPNKAGANPAQAKELLARCVEFDNLSIRGLMTILDRRTDPLEGYNRLSELFETLTVDAPEGWDTLSMGMSGDYVDAIRAGATFVRVGTAIFGPRDSDREEESETGVMS